MTDSWVALRHGGDSAIVLFPPGRPDESRWLGKDDAMPRFSPDGRWLLASGRHDHRFYRVGDWQPVHPESVAGRLQNATLAASAWTADSRLVALALDRNQLLLLKSGTWEEVVRLTTPQPAAFVALAFSPGNRWLAAGTGGGSVELWDLAELSTALAPMGLHLDQPVHDGEASLPDPRPERLPVSVKLPQNPASGYPPRSSEAGPGQLDLTPFFNARLDSSWGETDKDGIRSSLGELPVGLSRFNGVMFDVRGLVQLAGERFKDQSQRFPAEVTGIPIPQGMTMNRLHFLGAVLDGLPSIVRGGEVARVRFRYLDGGRREFPLRLGSELEDWWSKPRRPLRPANATVGWRGLNLGSENSGVSLQLYHVILPNPEPGRLVESVDIFSVGAAPSPFFVGLTVD